MTGDAAAFEWSAAHELTASLVELADHANRLFVRVHAKDAKLGEPVKVRRPGQKVERRQATAAELAQFFGSPRTTVADDAPSTVVL